MLTHSHSAEDAHIHSILHRNTPLIKAAGSYARITALEWSDLSLFSQKTSKRLRSSLGGLGILVLMLVGNGIQHIVILVICVGRINTFGFL